ncbi:Uncharacterised protein [Escherichia coli]|uniref:Uncharacterized protein n=1 Tax=Escherichia coli TaxID=562 RepID=A0A376FK90_ECOLX|nr:Uncharacterised protein [Escherichia coli]
MQRAACRWIAAHIQQTVQQRCDGFSVCATGDATFSHRACAGRSGQRGQQGEYGTGSKIARHTGFFSLHDDGDLAVLHLAGREYLIHLVRVGLHPGFCRKGGLTGEGHPPAGKGGLLADNAFILCCFDNGFIIRRGGRDYLVLNPALMVV